MIKSTESQSESLRDNPKCTFQEIVQYQCRLESNRVVCDPFVRIFKRCVGKPTIEVTPIYDKNGMPIKSGPKPPSSTKIDGFYDDEDEDFRAFKSLL
ncbi:10680_t:CDS:2 [Ambispora gerdemannii]|uniref:10680_t:CDS:1 n=1 Tax=Ambispora gerdemannii TaxID=144530 RepID=A0A9N8VK59_9GLOM|nr:10680_t:CDS:2 [Ambispora gerdemannii]